MRASWVGLAIGVFGVGCTAGDPETASSNRSLTPAAWELTVSRAEAASLPRLLPIDRPLGPVFLPDGQHDPTPPVCLVCPGSRRARFDNAIGRRTIEPALDAGALSSQLSRADLEAPFAARIAQGLDDLGTLTPDEAGDGAADALVSALLTDLNQLALR
jgi:hypothetical protein